MELFDLGIVVLAAVMVWLLYRVTRETREYAAPHMVYAYRTHEPRSSSRPRGWQSEHRRGEGYTPKRGIQ